MIWILRQSESDKLVSNVENGNPDTGPWDPAKTLRKKDSMCAYVYVGAVWWWNYSVRISEATAMFYNCDKSLRGLKRNK